MKTLLKIALLAPLVAILAGGAWVAWDLMAPFTPKDRLRISAVRPLPPEDVPPVLRAQTDAIVLRMTLDGPGLETLLDGGRHVAFYAHYCGTADSRLALMNAYLEDVPVGGGGRQYWEKPRSAPFNVLVPVPIAEARSEAYRCGEFMYEEHVDGRFHLTNGMDSFSNEVRLPPPVSPPSPPAAPP